jgi:hypothetical protein
VTFFAAVIETVQLLLLVESQPLQLVNVEPLAGVAVNVTLVPVLYVSVQSAPQSTPAGLLATAPLPVPALVTVNRNVGVTVGVLTVVLALPQAASEQLPLLGGSDGVPPVDPTVA